MIKLLVILFIIKLYARNIFTLYLVIKQNMTFYSLSKAETIINESDIDDVVKWIYTTITSNIKTFSGILLILS